MSSKAERLIVFDTNILLHYKRLDQLDWAGMCGTDVCLVLVPLVLRELEHHKTLPKTPKLKEKAVQTLAWLNKLFATGDEANIKDGVRARLVVSEPKIDFAANDLVREVQDDQLLASILALEATTGTFPTIFTADSTLRFKARSRGIPYIEPREEDKLVEEEDPLVKELARLRRENDQLKNARPKLDVQFKDGQQWLQLSRFAVKEVPPLLAEIKAMHPLQGKEAPPPPKHAWAMPSVNFGMSDAVCEMNNNDLNQFYAAYEGYLDKWEKWHHLWRASICMELQLVNTGYAPATDIDVTIELPRGLVALDKHMPDEPSRPKPPVLRNSLVAGILGNSYGGFDPSDRLPFIPDFSAIRPEVSISVTKSTASIKVPRLKHGDSKALPKFYVLVRDFEADAAMTLSVEISASELPVRLDQSLHLKS